jgi:hypothetical protein
MRCTLTLEAGERLTALGHRLAHEGRNVPEHHQPCSLPLPHGPVEPGPAPPGVPQCRGTS